MDESSELQRDLGFWSAPTIGTDTMIGAGIFPLAGRAIELAGPAALLLVPNAVGVKLRGSPRWSSCWP